ncbi:capsid protein [Lynx canadensis faeces associated genomovirus CL4 71]|uniref:Capsid protein n=1 Tax=Lynx canadensis faeces associated genomovirus CL1 71 TaxID=2219127 RepID=A0A2Z5CIB6_9VIRU|nr:capsid protein [Lynx canadensis faeces associated genomovirus CL1 71]AXB22603.1 capsid protein [Lynx canadensis faeces associated genomovirus CL1 71]AXB22613.1 capsid protein [Lynx canadensis faeces associated genomovirus CL4 71]
MAYARRPRRPAYRKKGARSTRRYSKRSYPRSSYVKRRPYRKRMTKKSILNVTSRKKRDTMAYYTNSTAASQTGGTTYVQDAAVVTGGTSVPACFLWCATGRDYTTSNAGTNGQIVDAASRTSQSCYMRGLKEALEVQVADGVPWQWRRICFTAKGLQTLFAATTGFSLVIEASTGYQRVLNQIPGDSATATSLRAVIETVLFKGVYLRDWIDPMTASTDNDRLTIKYDKTITIASGNEDGCIRNYKRWHGMNKTLVYNDDESGGTKVPAFYSTLGKAGMGDFYIMDYFRPRAGSTSTNQLRVSASSTLYWHEK